MPTGWVTPPSLDPADVGQIQVSFERQFLLGHSTLLTNTPDVLANNDAPILHAGWSTIGHIVSRDYIPYWQDFGTKRGHFKTFFSNRKTKVTEELSAPPLLPNLGEISNEANKWYYVVNGARQGPTTATTIRDLLSKKEIETDTQVWRKGMPEWKPLRESDLAELMAAEPPAISSQHIGNGFVWTLALLPLVFGVIDAAVSTSNQEAAARSLVLGFPYHLSRGLPVQVPVVINALLGWLDDRRLKQAGYGSR